MLFLVCLNLTNQSEGKAYEGIKGCLINCYRYIQMHRLQPLTCFFILLSILFSCKNSNQLASQSDHKYTNSLINETSPYLLQHAHNPVNWHPWGDEALAKAKKEDKLLIISIGYAACHWCHVMEHESFEDEEVANLMNEHFVPIKVDREERPDVDDVYMTACNLVTGRGGWPLNAFALPNGEPVWAGTYFPKEQWMNVLNQFIDLKENNADKLQESARKLTSGINSTGNLDLLAIPDDFSKRDFENSAKQMIKQFDQRKGGRRGAPKFPMPNNYEFLLKYGHIFHDKDALNTAFLSLDNMAYGGIYDQVGGGFARYSVDDAWKVPHFEKMLYDNGQLIGLYSLAYRLKPKPLYQKVIEQSLEFIERELTSSQGGFYTSLDADSEGVEGKFYVWTETELEEIIKDSALLATAKLYYSTEPNGNWEHSNILHVTQNPSNVAEKLGMDEDVLNQQILLINSLLLKERENRIRPGLDDKILTGWNALMISGYVEAYKALKNENYLAKARSTAEFMRREQLQDDFRLNRNYKEGRSTINGFLDDYGLMIKALLDLYEVTFEQEWVDLAQSLTDYVLIHFVNPKNQMLYLNSDLDPPLVSRSTEYTDNVIPSTNSTMARNLLRLGEMMYDKDYTTRAQQMFSNVYDHLKNAKQPGFYSNWLQLWLDLVHPPYEIVIVGNNAKTISQQLTKTYLANSTVLGSDVESEGLPLLKYKYVPGKTLIYVCESKVCQLPVEDVQEALEQIKFD